MRTMGEVDMVSSLQTARIIHGKKIQTGQSSLGRVEKAVILSVKLHNSTLHPCTALNGGEFHQQT